MSAAPSVIGIVAPSSRVPKVELRLGVELLEAQGFEVRVHPNTGRAFRYFAGTDEQRLAAFVDYAWDPSVGILWCARGGYGAMRLMEALEAEAARRGPPPGGKLLAGYSDASVLMEFVARKWDWSVLHAPMPGLRSFCQLSPQELSALASWVGRKKPARAWGVKPLRFLGAKPAHSIEGLLTGGNLCVWTSAVGTPYAPKCEGKLLFFEDVTESLYRLDRMLTQLRLTGSLNGARAIVLGNFLNCRDSVPVMLGRMPKNPKERKRMLENPKPKDLVPLRKTLAESKTILEIFGETAERLGVPLAYGLPVGHGPGHFALPLDARYRLQPDGRLELLQWKWTDFGN